MKRACLLALAAAASLAAPAGADPAMRRIDGFNVAYPIPAGWSVMRQLEHTDVLGSHTHAGILLVTPGLWRSAEQALADAQQFLAQQQLQGRAAGAPERLAGRLSGLAVTYEAAGNLGQPLQARLIGLAGSQGTGLVVLAVTTPAQFAGLRETAERLAAGAEAGAPRTNAQAVAALAGKWTAYAGGHDPARYRRTGSMHAHNETLWLDGRGGYAYHSSGYVSAGPTGSDYGTRTFETKDQGTYTVLGQDTLVLTGQRGTFVVRFVVKGGAIVTQAKTWIRG